jgi:tetratricopeptide (TPR) repeat protein
LNNRGTDLFFGKNYEKAIVLYRQAAEITPKSIEVKNNLANALLNGKYYTEAVEICRKSINNNEVNGNTLYDSRSAFLNSVITRKVWFRIKRRLNLINKMQES